MGSLLVHAQSGTVKLVGLGPRLLGSIREGVPSHDGGSSRCSWRHASKSLIAATINTGARA